MRVHRSLPGNPEAYSVWLPSEGLFGGLLSGFAKLHPDANHGAGIFTYMSPINHPNVGKYSIHRASGTWNINDYHAAMLLYSCILTIQHAPIYTPRIRMYLNSVR